MNKKLVTIFSILGMVSLLIAPLCLLYVDKNLFFPYITGKNFFWRFFVELAILGWMISALFNTKYRFSMKEPFFMALSSFMAIVLLANTFGHNSYFSFWSGAERMDGYISLLHLYAYFIALVGFIKNKKNIERIILYLLGIALILSIVGWGQEKNRIDSILGNPIYLASLSFFGVFLSGYFLVVKEKFLGFSEKARIIFFGLLALVFVYTIFRTGTRGALLGLVGGGFTASLLFLIYARDTTDKWWGYLGGLFVVSLLLAAGLFFGVREQLSETTFIQENVLLSRLVKMSPEDRTTKFRLTNWQTAIEGFKERPLLGWGQEQYSEVFSKHYNLRNLYNAEQWYDRVHNTFLDWLVFAGVLGLASYLSLFIIILWVLWKKADISLLQKSVLTGLFVGYLFQNMVAFDSLVSGIFLYSCFALVFVLTKDEQEEVESVESLHLRYLGTVILLLGTGAWMYYSIHLPLQSSKDYISHIRVLQKNNAESTEKALSNFEKVFETETFLSRELVEQAIQRRGHYLDKDVSVEVRQKYLETIITNSENSIIKYNSPTKLNLLFGALLLDLRLLDESEPYLVAAHKQSPNKAHISWVLASLYEKQGKIEEARALLKNIATQAPELIQAQDLYKKFTEGHPQ